MPLIIKMREMRRCCWSARAILVSADTPAAYTRQTRSGLGGLNQGRHGRVV